MTTISGKLFIIEQALRAADRVTTGYVNSQINKALSYICDIKVALQNAEAARAEID